MLMFIIYHTIVISGICISNFTKYSLRAPFTVPKYMYILKHCVRSKNVPYNREMDTVEFVMYTHVLVKYTVFRNPTTLTTLRMRLS